MGYGSSSKGGGGSGSSGGGKKKSGRKNQPKPREFKVKQQKSAVALPPPHLPAFTVIEPDPEKRTGLLAARKKGERDAKARKAASRIPVNGTSKTHGRILGTSADVDVDTTDDDKATTKRTEGNQLQQQTPTTDREKRLTFLAIQKAKAETARRDQIKVERIRQDALFVELIRLTEQNLEMLAARLSSRNEFEDVRRLLGVILKNAATKSDPKYKLLKAYSNDNLWRRLLRHPEIVTIFEKAAGFQRGNNIGEKRAAAAAKEKAMRIEMERNRINLLIVQALDKSFSSPSSDQSNPTEAAVASLFADLAALEVEEQTPLVRSCAVVDNDEAQDRDFELCHPGAGEDGLRIKQIFAILRVVNRSDCGGNCN